MPPARPLSRLPEPSPVVLPDGTVLVSSPRSRFGFVLVERPFSAGASKRPLSSDSAPASIVAALLSKGELIRIL